MGESDRHCTKENKPPKHMGRGYVSFNARLLMSSLEAENRMMLPKAGKSGNYLLDGVLNDMI